MNTKFYDLLLCSLPFALCSLQGESAMRIGNNSRSYADAYAQVGMMAQQAQPLTGAQESLPVRVADAALTDAIVAGQAPDVVLTDLEKCAAIYPNGEFAWDVPNVGIKMGSKPQCVAVVEMKASIKKGDKMGDVVVAKALLAAGDSFDCNISKFPEAGYTPDAGNVVFPADKEPTIEDVVKQMNEEQKKGAGIKIAAGLVVGGILGNMSGKNAPGQTSLVGAGSGKMTNTAIGALGGAGLMAASSYAGKTGGDMIMSAGVNAVAGGVIGNMVASGDSVLQIEPCANGADKKTCLWGVVRTGIKLKDAKSDYDQAFYNINTGETVICSKFGNCEKQELLNIRFKEKEYSTPEQALAERKGGKGQTFQKWRDSSKLVAITAQSATNHPNNKLQYSAENASQQVWARLDGVGDALLPTINVPALIWNFEDSPFGKKKADWVKEKGAITSDRIRNRGSGMEVGNQLEGEYAEIENFYPLYRDADDGGIIDINNKARLKSTMIGAGAGAGLGAFTAYQGAQDEIDERWIAAVTEYKDSMQKFFCTTGKRLLTPYNDIVMIPAMKQ